MLNTRLPNSIFFALVALGAVQLSYYAPRIPEILGSHFSGGGFVNGWQTKAAFFGTELAMIILATVVSFGIPRIIAAAAGLYSSVVRVVWLRAPDVFAFRNGVSLPRQLAHSAAIQQRCFRSRPTGVRCLRHYVSPPPHPPLLENYSSLTVRRHRIVGLNENASEIGGVSLLIPSEIRSKDNRGMGLRGRHAACANAMDDAACVGLWLRSGGCARE